MSLSISRRICISPSLYFPLPMCLYLFPSSLSLSLWPCLFVAGIKFDKIKFEYLKSYNRVHPSRGVKKIRLIKWEEYPYTQFFVCPVNVREFLCFVEKNPERFLIYFPLKLFLLFSCWTVYEISRRIFGQAFGGFFSITFGAFLASLFIKLCVKFLSNFLVQTFGGFFGRI